MSISSMTGLALARNLREPTKADVGVVVVESDDADKAPTLTDILAKTVPVGLVTAYTAFIAVVTEVVAAPTAEDPNPDQYLWVRWLAFVILVATAGFLSYGMYLAKSKKLKSGVKRTPVLEISAVVIAAVAWGLGIPESPLLAGIDGKEQGLMVLALISFAGVAANLVISTYLKKPASH